MEILNRDRKFNIDMTHREEVLTKIAHRLQQEFGRGKPSIYEYREYERNKLKITDRVKNFKHICEKDLPESEKILLTDIKVENVVTTSLDDVSSDDEGDKTFEKYYEKKKPREDREPQRFGDARTEQRG